MKMPVIAMMQAVFLLVLASNLCMSLAASFYWDYIIVGAGPSGVQLGYFMQQKQRNYVILEKANHSGSFFSVYPRHDKLISINKRNTGKKNKEFNLRHDWNSLISHDETLLFKHYSKKFLPDRRDFLRYIDDYQKKLEINVQYNTEVSEVQRVYNESRGDYGFTMHDQNGNVYTCRALVLATGLSTPNIPNFEGVEYTEGYEDIPIDEESYEGQTVLILGRGNAAFEVADGIYGATNLVHMISRSRVRLSWATHYVGDLRAVNNALLDTYQLKSLDGVLEASINDMKLVKREDGRLLIDIGQDNDTSEAVAFDNFAMREPYDRVIRCLGFKFDDSIFHNSIAISHGSGRKKKFLSLNHNYESNDVPGMFVAGTASHYVDHRKSAGGFIHGFRYTAKTLHHILEWKYQSEPWPSTQVARKDLLSTILKRINEASSIYQMFAVLGDVFVFRNDGAYFEHYQDFPINMLHEFTNLTGVKADKILALVMEYGANFSGPGKDIFRLDRATGEPSEAHKSNFLHPVFYYYTSIPTEEDMNNKPKGEALPRPQRLHHVVEDFLTSWDGPISHVLPLRRFLENIMNQDMRNYFAEECLNMALLYDSVPVSCQDGFLQGQGLVGTNELKAQPKLAGLLNL